MGDKVDIRVLVQDGLWREGDAVLFDPTLPGDDGVCDEG